MAPFRPLLHGYCRKLTHDVWEARLIRETAAKHPELATQTGNQGHASPRRRQIKELLMAGAIGPVREAHVWAGRAWGLQSAASADKHDKAHGFYNGIQITDRFKEEMPVPPNIDWDRWIGPNGTFIGMTGFGASAPASGLYEHFGITSERVCQEALALTGKG